MAAWVWGAGGRFLSTDDKLTGFNSAQAYAGLRAYYDLHRSLTPPARNLGTDEADRLNQIWAEVFAKPDLDLEAAIEGHLKPLSQQLDATLAGQ